MEPTGASGSGQFKGVGRWPLAPAAHAQRYCLLAMLVI
jgi:hypothetical protein